ncbi:hypothetical protein B4073_0839 [Bacillus subtilis]|uniref:condensation domain-containing protein n=1 Tax=Bacillus subtilis TaxID=1423 RepID=UPI00059EC395|nr:condensation domain-containing protein [Bacillus subtilis]KIN31506.1 hypothetical protein B4068_0851 [Bacillus subtilis]KIN56070.1 hypothetical protein B4073_0839 [Bacillus subtilis]
MAHVFDGKLLDMKEYWEDQLSGKINKVSIPSKSRENDDIVEDFETYDFNFGEQTVERMRDLTGDSLFLKYVLVLASMNICLYKYNRNNYITIGSSAIKGHNTLNNSTADLPIVSHLEEEMTGKEIVRNLRINLLKGYENQSYPKHLLMKYLGIRDHSSLYCIHTELTNIHILTNTEFDIKLQLTYKDGNIVGSMKYKKELFQLANIKLFSQHIRYILDYLLTDLDFSLKQMPDCDISVDSNDTENKDDHIRNIKMTLKKHPSVEDTRVFYKDDKALIAQIKSKPNQIRSNQLLKAFLNKKFPGEEILIEFVWVEELSKEHEKQKDILTNNYKNDLLNISPPRNELEEHIANIWCEILSINRVGVHDNFFEIGGDSILSLELHYKMKYQGLFVTPKDIIANPTIAELAKSVSHKKTFELSQEKITGTMPLTPPVKKFFEQNFYNVNYYNNAWYYDVYDELIIENVEKALNLVAEHHDGLRLRYKKDKNKWVQFFSLEERVFPFYSYDLSNIPHDKVYDEMERISNYQHSTINITDGPLIKAVLFKLETDVSDKLLIISHRLLTDGVSMKVLAEDFQNCYNNLTLQKDVKFPEKTTSLKKWANGLLGLAKSSNILNDKTYWENDKFKKGNKIPVDYPEIENLESSTEMIIRSLSKKQTEILTKKLPSKLDVTINDILFTSFLYTIAEWTRKDYLIIETGGHGRESVLDEVDLSRTVGYFNTNYPIYLELDKSLTILENLYSVSKQVSNVPNNGINYGILKYLNGELDNKSILKSISKPPIGFDFQGILTKTHDERNSEIFVPKNILLGKERDPNNHREYEFDISSWVEKDQYILRWGFNSHRYNETTIDGLIKVYFKRLSDMADLYCNE